MVKKLIKHEFIYYLRSLLIIFPVVIVMGLFTCIVQLFENKTVWYVIIQVGSYTLLVTIGVPPLLLEALSKTIVFGLLLLRLSIKNLYPIRPSP